MSAKSVRTEVRLRSGNYCEARVECNGTWAVLFHHRKRAGRVDTVDNLLHLCALCHVWVHHNIAKAESLGLLVRSTDDPAQIPWQWGAVA